MTTAAQEEVQRLFSQDHTRFRSHPEDLNDSDRESADEKNTTEPAFAADPNQDTDDEDYNDKMASLTTTKSTYILPATVQYANTGPKGVIADAQSFTRAKRDAYKIPLTTVTNIALSRKAQETELGSGSEEEEGEDEEFMAQWRANRLAELAATTGSNQILSPQRGQQRRISPSRRTYGSAVNVDAAGYLDAIEKVSPDTVVVVMIYDPESEQSLEVEDEIDILAYKYGQVRFVKLNHEVAEMEHVQIPALLAYKGGELEATVSGAKRDGLEKMFEKQILLR